MKPDLARLVLTGQGSSKRLAAIVAGVGVGVAMLLLLLGADHGLTLREDRTQWMNEPALAYSRETQHLDPLTDDTAWMVAHQDVFRGRVITWFDIALTSDSRVVLPGGAPRPPEGLYLASPALAGLIASVPPDQLGDRFGRSAGVLPSAALAGPDSLVLVRLVAPEAIQDDVDMRLADATLTGVPEHSESGPYRIVLIIGAIALLIPIVLLKSIVTGLGSSQRRERYQTLRLIGATPGDVARIALVEMGVAALAGSAIGVLLGWCLRPLAALIPVSDTRFYTTDLAPGPLVIVGVVIAVTVLAGLAALRRAYHDGIGPLGATRATVEATPGLVRLVPLVVGVGMLAVLHDRRVQDDLAVMLALAGFTTSAVGIIVAGPLLIRFVSRVYARHVGTAAAVVSAGRLRQHPVASFRAISGLVIALFMVTFFAALASIATGEHSVADVPGLMPRSTAYTVVDNKTTANGLQARLTGVDGVTQVIVGRIAARDATSPPDVVLTSADAWALGFPDVPPAGCVATSVDSYTSPYSSSGATLTPIDCGAANAEGVIPVFVLTDASQAAMERAVTAVATSGLSPEPLTTRTSLADIVAAGMINTMARLAYLGVVVIILIAGVSLAVSSASSVLEHQRTYGLMRLAGMPPTTLWKALSLEALVPLGLTVVSTIGLGFGVAWVIMTDLYGQKLGWPDGGYYLALAAALGIAVLAVTATFGPLTRATRVQTVRFE